MARKLYPITEVAEIISASSHIISAQSEINTLAYDTRRLRFVEHALFFALQGLRDGHDFVEQAYLGGIRNFVIHQHDFPMDNFREANFLVVPDTLIALQNLAAYHRRQFSYPVIAITGSHGKTIVKEWLHHLLAPDFLIARSPKSYNSQIGVALSLWEMADHHQMAIIEAGISLPGEMEILTNMIAPDLAVLTGIGAAHAAGFKDDTEKFREKTRLLRAAKKYVMPEKLFSAWQAENLSNASKGEGYFWNWEHEPTGGINCSLKCPPTCSGAEDVRIMTEPLTLPKKDRFYIENAISCWAVLKMLGYSREIIQDRMTDLPQQEMRLELKTGIHPSSVIDDTYSNDLSSLRIALDFLAQQNQHPLKTLVLSDLPEVETREDDAYAELVQLLKDARLDRLVLVGPELTKRQALFDTDEILSFADTRSLLERLPQIAWANHSILLKGARKFGFERISALLTAKSHATTLEIDLNEVEHNLHYFKSMLPPAVGMMVMVKAFSYGAGSFEIANLLQYHQVAYLAVAFADEGVALRKSGIHLPIMVMNPDPISFANIHKYRLEPEIFSQGILDAWIGWLKNQQEEEWPIHLKLDTGMHRLGFSEDDLPLLMKTIQNQKEIKVKSVFSHLAASGDSALDAFTQEQINKFEGWAKALEGKLDEPVLKHLANTDAIMRFPDAYFDLVRLGIGLYGFGSMNKHLIAPAIQLKTHITQLKTLKPGDTVGYGRKGVIHQESQIATIRIGYADGYDRRFGNGRGYMMISGHKVPTIGDICMDMCMIDVTGLHVHIGDEVLVYPDLQEQAANIGTIPYELLVNVSQRVKRVYFYN